MTKRTSTKPKSKAKPTFSFRVLLTETSSYATVIKAADEQSALAEAERRWVEYGDQKFNCKCSEFDIVDVERIAEFRIR